MLILDVSYKLREIKDNLRNNQFRMRDFNNRNNKFIKLNVYYIFIIGFGQVSNLENGGFWTSQLAVV